MASGDQFEHPGDGNEGRVAPFLRKTYGFVEDPATDHLVKWSSSGRSFLVLDVEAFAKEILPKFFKHSNWSSFVRQLNTYGFRKVDPDRWEFANEHFTRGGKEAMNEILRRKTAAALTVRDQPNLQQQQQQYMQQQGMIADAQQSQENQYMLYMQQQQQHMHQQGMAAHSQQMQQQYMQQQGMAAQNQMQQQYMQGMQQQIPQNQLMQQQQHYMQQHAQQQSQQMLPPQQQQYLPQFDMRQQPMPMYQQAQTGMQGGPSTQLEQQQALGPASQGSGGSGGYPGQQQLSGGSGQNDGSGGNGGWSGGNNNGGSGRGVVTQGFQRQRSQVLADAAAVAAGQPAAPTPAAGAGVDRMTALVGDYLRPGQRILANIGGTQPGQQPQQDSHSSSGTSGPDAASTAHKGSKDSGDVEEDRKVSKRTRGDMNMLQGQGGQPQWRMKDILDASDSCDPKVDKEAAARQVPEPQTADGMASEDKESEANQGQQGAAPGDTSLDKHGNHLPKGITRPIAQPLSNTTSNLISEMAGQLGRLTQLAGEVKGLREENLQLKWGMDAMNARQPQPNVAPIHAMMAEQRDAMWQYKLKNDDVELKIAAQQVAQKTQEDRSIFMEAQMAQQHKLAYDNAEVTRFLEARNSDLASRLFQQEGVNHLQGKYNSALEARVAELEAQLIAGMEKQTNAQDAEMERGRHEMMLKGIEDRVFKSMSDMMIARGGFGRPAVEHASPVMVGEPQSDGSDAVGAQHPATSRPGGQPSMTQSRGPRLSNSNEASNEPTPQHTTSTVSDENNELDTANAAMVVGQGYVEGALGQLTCEERPAPRAQGGNGP